jgi:hypothetical protein
MRSLAGPLEAKCRILADQSYNLGVRRVEMKKLDATCQVSSRWQGQRLVLALHAWRRREGEICGLTLEICRE